MKIKAKPLTGIWTLAPLSGSLSAGQKPGKRQTSQIGATINDRLVLLMPEEVWYSPTP
jgi:hypothetical protein